MQNLATPTIRGCLLCDLSVAPLLLPSLALDASLGHTRAALCCHKATATPRRLQGLSHCQLQLGGLSAASLPIGCHLQTEASLHLHELLIVPQPVSHGQGKGCLLILQAGDLSLKRTEGFGIRGLELCWVELKVPRAQNTKRDEKSPSLL